MLSEMKVVHELRLKKLGYVISERMLEVIRPMCLILGGMTHEYWGIWTSMSRECCEIGRIFRLYQMVVEMLTA
jgi:hypothetical protein